MDKKQIESIIKTLNQANESHAQAIELLLKSYGKKNQAVKELIKMLEKIKQND